MANGNKVVNIKAFPRLHITLIGMNNLGYRINGGIGFAIDNPCIIFRIKQSNSFVLSDIRQSPIDPNQLERLRVKISEIITSRQFKHNICVEISGQLMPHVGLGSGTIIRLALIEALFILNDVQHTAEDIADLSGRGGTSGIGIRTYFEGGFVFDSGQRNRGQPLLPSSSLENSANYSLLICKGSMPSWSFGLCIPEGKPAQNEYNEADFFNRNSALANNEVSEILYQVVYGLLGGILEDDVGAFIEALVKIQQSAWKNAERKIYVNKIEQIESILYQNGATSIGMSSLGPSLFFLGSDVGDIINKCSELLPTCTFRLIKPINRGRIIEIQNV